ncbi:jg15746 [Pararge aegeria aegeria]|uniref:Jg15746 protein n=1 Tax=Pararge aegeria aegeria TaxID=348720 RepID=A0A8S4RMD4_9NEOP|nr:jg15746 [Pararge aegeria aegeria]
MVSPYLSHRRYGLAAESREGRGEAGGVPTRLRSLQIFARRLFAPLITSLANTPSPLRSAYIRALRSLHIPMFKMTVAKPSLQLEYLYRRTLDEAGRLGNYSFRGAFTRKSLQTDSRVTQDTLATPPIAGSKVGDSRVAGTSAVRPDTVSVTDNKFNQCALGFSWPFLLKSCNIILNFIIDNKLSNSPSASWSVSEEPRCALFCFSIVLEHYVYRCCIRLHACSDRRTVSYT